MGKMVYRNREEKNAVINKAMESLKSFANGILEVTKKFNEGFRKKPIERGVNNMSMEDMLKEIKESEGREKAMKKGKKNKTIKNWEKNKFYQK
ncbi:hypothetical protein [Clostridium baratii]|uniref:hypothetical protein n=1 Tax=Clostridium baratii TaxID=1561 RepID=UPI0030CB02E4